MSCELGRYFVFAPNPLISVYLLGRVHLNAIAQAIVQPCTLHKYCAFYFALRFEMLHQDVKKWSEKQHKALRLEQGLEPKPRLPGAPEPKRIGASELNEHMSRYDDCSLRTALFDCQTPPVHEGTVARPPRKTSCCISYSISPTPRGFPPFLRLSKPKMIKPKIDSNRNQMPTWRPVSPRPSMPSIAATKRRPMSAGRARGRLHIIA
eukprot:scaffold282477_cov36-Tisochrysis_lutea.AAC.3